MTPTNGPSLRDIHLPPEPGWWPPAPGWWLLALIAATVIVVAIAMLRRARRRRRRRREILAELDRHIQRARGDRVRLAAELSQFVRRLAIKDKPETVAWEGQRWLGYLDTRSDGEEFRHGVGKALIDAPYRPVADFDDAALIALVRRWTRNTLDSGAVNV